VEILGFYDGYDKESGKLLINSMLIRDLRM
jgi:hypothetical protein